jgi:diaminopimelate decarboxylase
VTGLRARVKALLVRARHAHEERRRRHLDQVDGALPPALWDAQIDRAGHLVVSGCDIVELARRHGTPLHVVSRPRLAKDFGRFSRAFAKRWPKVEIAYSYKTNPLPGVLRELHALGAWAEVISHFELWLALELGVAPDRIVYNGPAKSAEGLRLAIARGVRLINVDNLDEIEQVGRIARELGARQRVGVRVVTSVGWSGQFGHRIEGGEADAAFSRLCAIDSVEACGLHVHLGTGLKDVSTYVTAIREVVEFGRRVERERSTRIRYLDFGGGFGVPTVRALDAWDERLMALGYPPGPVDLATTPPIEALAEAVVAELRRHYPDAGDPELPIVLLEPGRAITSASQLLALRVLAVKPGADGSRRVILDGGKNIAIPTGYELHELLPASSMRKPCTAFHHFYGPLCHPGDVLARWKRFPAIGIGDVVALMDAGAYFVPNQMNFSNPRPAAVMVDEGRDWVIRERESFEDIVRLDDASGKSMAGGRADRRVGARSAD